MSETPRTDALKAEDWLDGEPSDSVTLDAAFLQKLGDLAKRLMAIKIFHPDAHTVFEAAIMLAQSLERITAAERQLEAIADVIGYPKESWRIAGCDVLSHAIADLQRSYIALRDERQNVDTSEHQKEPDVYSTFGRAK